MLPSLRRAVPWAGALTALTLAALIAGAPRPCVDNAPAAWFPRRDPRIAGYREFQASFGADEVVAVSLQGGPLPGLLALCAELEQALGAQACTAQVLGPSRAFPTEVQVLGDPELARDGLKFVGWAFAGPLNRGLHLLDPQVPAARVIAVLAPGQPAARQELAGLIAGFRARAAAQGRTLRVAGQPLVNLELDRAAAQVEGQNMPWLVAACAGLLLLLTRSPRRSLALLLPVGLSVLALDGLLGISGASSNLIVAIAKPLAFVILLATGYHLLVAYEDGRLAGEHGWQAALGAARAKAPACLLALGTTAVGFGSLVSSDVQPIRTFGWVSALGLLLLGAPALLLLLPLLLAWSGAPPARAASVRLGDGVAALVEGSARRWRLLVPLGLGVVAAGALAATHLTTQPHAIRYLAPSHPLRADHEALAAAGVPLAQLEAVVTGTAPIASDAALLARLDRWTRSLEELPGVRAQVSLPLILREAGYRTARRDSLPADFLIDDVIARRRADVAPYVARGGRALRVSLAIDTLGPEELDRLRRQARESFRAQLGDTGLRLSLTGDYDLLLRTQRSLLGTLRSSLVLTAILMQLVLLVVLRDLRAGLAAVLPNALPVAVIFLLLGGLGLPVDVGTAMTAAIALGIAVDDTLHLLFAWRRSGLRAAARGSARAVLLSSLVIAAGFLALAPSPFLPTRNFGLLCAAAMLAALVGDLVLLPACLSALGCEPQPASPDGVSDRPRCAASPLSGHAVRAPADAERSAGQSSLTP